MQFPLWEGGRQGIDNVLCVDVSTHNFVLRSFVGYDQTVSEMHRYSLS